MSLADENNKNGIVFSGAEVEGSQNADVRTKERIVREFLQLAEIDSVSFKERKMADALTRKLEELGLSVTEDSAGELIGGNAGNLFAVWEGDPELEPVLLSAHMDTVVPGLGKKPIIEKVKRDSADAQIGAGESEVTLIQSDGNTVLGADDLAGVTEILEGIRRVQESGAKHRTVEILFTVSEEVYTKGARVFDYSKVRSKQAYCLDLSGDAGAAVNKAPTLLSFRIKVKGRAAHAGFAPEKGINAIAVAASAIAKIKQGRVDEDSTLNIGTIQGGSATNIVSEECVVEGEIRSYVHEKALRLYEEVKQTFESKANTIESTYELHLTAYEVNEKSPVVTRFREACEALGLKGELKPTFGGADNHQFNANGIEGIVLSCGMENVHTTGEYIKVSNLVSGSKLVEKIILP